LNEVCFATSNEHKFREAEFILRDERELRLTRLSSKGVEVQSDDVSEIASTAAAAAFRAHRRPLIVEDTGLSISTLGGFPGSYGAYVFRTIGLRGVLHLLQGKEDRRAEFTSAVAFCDGPEAPRVFTGALKGEIADSPRGEQGFGFDPIFVPMGFSRTLAEMSIEEKCKISHRSLALRSFASWASLRRTG